MYNIPPVFSLFIHLFLELKYKKCCNYFLIIIFFLHLIENVEK